MGSVLCSQNDDSGVNALHCKHFPTFYVFEHITCFYHGISSLGNSQGSELLTYFLLPSVPADEPPILPKSTKGTAPPETCGRMPFHFSIPLYCTRIGLIDRDSASFALACPRATTSESVY